MIYIRMTRAVKALLITIFAAFLIQQTVDRWFDGNLLYFFGLVPQGFLLEFRIWQLFTYPFLHGDVMHLFLNMLMLAFIGGEVESVWGTRRFLKFYFLCSSVAGLVYILLQVLIFGGVGVPMVGASGAIYGLLMAYGLLFGERVLLFMLLFPMKAKHFVWILAGVEFMTTVFSPHGGLSSAAHLAGMVTGFVYLWGGAAWRVARKRRAAGLDWRTGQPVRKRRRRKSHLRLIVNEDEFEDDKGPKTWH